MTTQFVPNSMSLPPPADLELFDEGRLVGWVRGPTVGFRGFASPNEVAGAAWIAHRTIARRLARRHGGPPAPIDVEPLTVAQDGDRALVLASGRPIATLVVPGANSLSGPDSFGFEIEMPATGANELSMRSLAYRIYRTLRKSGARWAMWETRRANRRLVPSRRRPVWVATRRASDGSPPAIVFVSKFLLAALAIVLGAALIVAAPRTVSIPIGMVLAAGLVASVLVPLVDRWRAAREAQPARSRRSAAAVAAHSGVGERPRADDPSDESMRERGWLALGAVSIALLMLAIVVPEELAVAFAAIGLAGLVVFRLTAASVVWGPDRTAARVGSGAPDEASARRTERASRSMPWRSNAAANGMSPRSASS